MTGKALTDVRFAKAQDVMTKRIVTIDGSATVAEAVKRMREENVPCLIVDRRTHDDAWGILTKKDVVTKVVDPGKHVTDVHVYEIMSKPMVTVAPGLALKYCARLFRMSGIRRAPVFDGKQIIGMLSFNDIFNAIGDESHLIANLIEEDPADELLPPTEEEAEQEQEEREQASVNDNLTGFGADAI